MHASTSTIYTSCTSIAPSPTPTGSGLMVDMGTEQQQYQRERERGRQVKSHNNWILMDGLGSYLFLFLDDREL